MLSRVRLVKFGAFISLLASFFALSVVSATPALATGVTGVTINQTGPNYDITVDCGAFLGSYDGIRMAARATDTLTVHVTNCATNGFDVTAWGWTPFGVIPLPAGADPKMVGSNGEGTWVPDTWYNPASPIAVPQTFTMTPGTEVFIDSQDNSVWKPIDFRALEPIPDPIGALAYSDTAVMSDQSPEMTVPGNAAYSENYYLGGNTDCRLRAGVHLYETMDVEVSSSGSYTFRYVDSTPKSHYLYNWLDMLPGSDSFMAVYTSFDPSQLDNNLVGCNDNLSGIYAGGAEMFVTSDDHILSNLDPQFTSSLDSSVSTHYTVVITTFYPNSQASWAAANYGTVSSSFQMWGPEGGFVVPQTNVLFDLQMGSATYSQTVNLGSNIIFPDNPPREGYEFLGWSLEPEGEILTEYVATSREDVTLFAQWRALESNTSTNEPSLANTGGLTLPLGLLALAVVLSGVSMFFARKRKS